jgi:uncharacterized phage protein (TIGR01671 family)
MNRELKFRVYIPDHEKLCYFNLTHFDYSDRYLSQHLYPVQQYTGLKDKNGVEIYEGDIVKATSDQYKNENFVGKVIFDEGCFLTWINKNDIRGVWSGEDIGVVGNIYETPELLNQLGVIETTK